jgi:uncharacterized membrane protein
MNALFMAVLIALSIVGVAVLLRTLRNAQTSRPATYVATLILVGTIVVMVSGGPSYAQSGLEIELQPIWDGINDNLPWALTLMGAIGGISIALGLGQWIVGLFQKFFKGGNSR